MQNHEPNIAVYFTEPGGYCTRTPYDPPERYPEYRGKSVDTANRTYAAVRGTLWRLGLDRERFGTPEWNPFGQIVRPGMTVFIKPNTVSQANLAGYDLFSVIVHASILRPILDYLCLALRGSGRIIIGDSQVIHSEFEPAMERSGIAELLRRYRVETAIPIECFDLRLVRGVRSWLYGRWARKKVEQDPRGYRTVDLAEESYFRDIDPVKLRIAIASYKNMFRYHSEGKHQYVLPGSFLDSDAVINIAKLKTHRRTAVTLALKNFMGIPALKDSLPHFMTGSPSEGGDQYAHPSLRKRICLHLHDGIQSSPFMPVKFALAVIKKAIWSTSRIVPFPDPVFEAMWPGNDTLWRTLLDLNRISIYADRKGILRDTPQRSILHLVDGIVGGEADGPLSPRPVASNTLIAGFNAAFVDAVGATLMGFDFKKIPMISRAFLDGSHAHPVCTGSPSDIVIDVDGQRLTLKSFGERFNLSFAAHPNWAGKVERNIRNGEIGV